MSRPFRFAVQAVKTRSAAEWRDFSREAEALGYSTLFLADHYLGKGPAMDRQPQPLQYVGPIAAMTAAAMSTTTLRVGCRVFCVDYHVPAALVKEAVSIDLLSDGRLEFGIGAGWNPIEYAALGLDFREPPARVRKLREVVAIFKAHCSGELLALDGEFATAKDYIGLPQPVQRPHPPIMIGGGGRFVLSYAAREADIVSINTVPMQTDADGGTPQDHARTRIETVRNAAGPRLADLDIESSAFFTVVTEDIELAAERLGAALRTPSAGLPDHPNVLLGTVDQMVERLQERRETYGVNYVTVQQSDMRAFAPVVDRLAGC
jgi:probable F420-dependent oxidoreductase